MDAKWLLMFWLTIPGETGIGHGEIEYDSLAACENAATSLKLEMRRRRMYRGVVDDHLVWACKEND